MWELTFNAPVGCRARKNVFNWIQVDEKDGNELPYMWANKDERIFKEKDHFKNRSFSNSLSGINSVKAFERYLRKHCDHLHQYEIVLCSRYYMKDANNKTLYDYTVTANWIEK